jgi:hypothetical protein
MGSSASMLPETLNRDQCKQYAGVRWENGLAEIFEDAVKNNDGAISRFQYTELFQLDPWQVPQLRTTVFIIST